MNMTDYAKEMISKHVDPFINERITGVRIEHLKRNRIRISFIDDDEEALFYLEETIVPGSTWTIPKLLDSGSFNVTFV